MDVFKPDQFDVTAQGTLVAEASQLRIRQMPCRMLVGAVLYTLHAVDMNGDDVAGWRFRAGACGRPLLIVNDYYSD